MVHENVWRRLGDNATAHLTDACIRLGLPVRCAPAGIHSVLAGSRLAGPAIPARHSGSVDVFLEAIDRAAPRGVLVVDNGGRLDEACVGDLVVHEAKAADLAGLVVWGLHRDTADIRGIGLPVFSLGALPTGPLELRQRAADALDQARVGEWTVTSSDTVVADDDGAVFFPSGRVDDVIDVAGAIHDAERRQADRVAAGDTLRSQFQFAAYLAKREQDAGLTFREHLRDIGGAIEE